MLIKLGNKTIYSNKKKDTQHDQPIKKLCNQKQLETNVVDIPNRFSFFIQFDLRTSNKYNLNSTF